MAVEMRPEEIAAIREPVIWQLADALPSANVRQRRMRPLTAIKRIGIHIDDQVRPVRYDPARRSYNQAMYHIGRNWQEKAGKAPVYGFGLMYHYKLSYSGGVARIWRTQPETLVTWHASSWNYEGVALCIDSGAGQAPESAILEELHRWLKWMCYRRPDIPAGQADVWGHTEESNTTKSCPATYLPWVQRFRKGDW
jgi:hypothetical protein